MEDSRNIIKAIDALTLKAGGKVVDSKNITEAIDNLTGSLDLEVERGNITIYPGRGLESGTLDLHTCVKKNGIVMVSARIHSLSQSVTADGIFFRIPIGFWPTASQVRCAGAALIDQEGWVPAALTISPTNGYVEFPYSKSKTVSMLFFNATYVI